MGKLKLFIYKTRWWWLTSLLSIAVPFVPLLLFDPAIDLVSARDPFNRSDTTVARYYMDTEQRYFDLVYTPTWVITGTLKPVASPLSVTVRHEDKGTYGTADSSNDGKWFTTTARLEPYRNIAVVQPAWGRPFPYPAYFLPDRSAGLPLDPITRTVHISLTEQEADIDYWVEIPSDTTNSDLKDFVQGQMPATLFIKRLFYPNNNSFSGIELARVSAPVVARDSRRWQVKIQGIMSGWQFTSRNLGEALALTMPQASMTGNGAATTIRLTFKDVTDYAVEPPPDQWDEKTNTLTWFGIIPTLKKQEANLSSTSGSAASVWQTLRLGLVFSAGVLHTPLLFALPLVPFVWILGALWQAQRRQPKKSISHDPSLAYLIRILYLGMLMWGIIILLIQGATWARSNLGQTYLAIWTATLVFATIIPLLYIIGTDSQEQQDNRREAGLWVITVFAVLALTLILFRVSGGVFGSSWLLAIAAGIIVCVILGMACELLKPGTWRGIFSRRGVIAVGLIGIASAILCLPTTENIIAVSPEWGWSVSVWRDLYFTIGIFLLPYLPLLALLRVLRRYTKHLQMPEATTVERLIAGPFGLGHLLFAFYLVGMLRGSDISIPPSAGSLLPIAFILALFVYPVLIRRRALSVHPPQKLGILIQQVFEIEAAERALGNLNKKFFDGEVASIEDYEKEREKLQTSLSKHPSPSNPRALVFAFGSKPSHWANAAQACRYAVLPIVLLGCLYAPSILERAVNQLVTPFLILQTTAIFLIPFFFRWFLYAFFLGYFFTYLPGQNGWQKGLALALGIAVCTVPNDIVLGTGANISSMLLDVGQTVLFLMGLGVWAFDYQIMKANNFGWRDLLIVHNVPATAITFATSLVGAFSGAVITGLTQGVPAIFNNLVNLVLPAVQAGSR